MPSWRRCTSPSPRCGSGAARGARRAEARRPRGHGPASRSPSWRSTPTLAALFDAVSRRAAVTFGYRGAAPPRALRRRAPLGHWYVVGHDLDRDAPRAFRADRIEGDRSAPPARSSPARLDPATYLRDDPLRLRRRPPGRGARPRRRDTGELGGRAARRDAVVERRDDGGVVVVGLPVVNRAAFRRGCWGCSTTPRCSGPPELRAELVAWLEAIAWQAGRRREPAPTPSAAPRPRARDGAVDPRPPRRRPSPSSRRASRCRAELERDLELLLIAGCRRTPPTGSSTSGSTTAPCASASPSTSTDRCGSRPPKARDPRRGPRAARGAGLRPAGPLATALAKLEDGARRSRPARGRRRRERPPRALRRRRPRGERVEIDYYSFARDEITTASSTRGAPFHAFGALVPRGVVPPRAATSACSASTASAPSGRPARRSSHRSAASRDSSSRHGDSCTDPQPENPRVTLSLRAVGRLGRGELPRTRASRTWPTARSGWSWRSARPRGSSASCSALGPEARVAAPDRSAAGRTGRRARATRAGTAR